MQKGILDHLQTLARTSGTAVLFVTHDLGVAADRAARIAVMSEGVIVECAPAARLFGAPSAPYTRRLLHSAPRLDAPPIAPPPARDRPPILEAQHLTKDFPLPRSAGGERTLRAVDDVGITVHRGETVALVGESGSGKSTTARLILRLTPPTAGRILLDGEDLTDARGARLRTLRRRQRDDAPTGPARQRRVVQLYQELRRFAEPSNTRAPSAGWKRLRANSAFGRPVRAIEQAYTSEQNSRLGTLLIFS